MCENIQNCCRICLDMEANHVSILGDPTICLHLRSCLAMSVSDNDHLPKSICVSCVSQLSQFYNFQVNARCSQDWLESSKQEKSKKGAETKAPLQPLPDSEYNSDSLLEFLNNTANIEEYLNNLGKEDIPSIVNMLDRNEHTFEFSKLTSFKSLKLPSPLKKDMKPNGSEIQMEIDVLDSDIEIVKEIIMKEVEPKLKADMNFFTCYGCKLKYDSIQKLCRHVSTCDNASRTCIQCDTLFDSRQKMLEHSTTHTFLTLSCKCGDQFRNKEKLILHQKTCRSDYGANIDCTFRCKECGDKFKERFQLYRHVRVHIIKAEEQKCDICNHIYIGMDALLEHKQIEHNQSEAKMYRCKVCGHTSTEHKHMYLHVKTHTSKPTLKRHLCESCGKSFSTRAILTRHCQQHNKTHRCSVCDKCFTNEKEREGHMTEHSELAVCERCGKTVRSYQFDGHSCEEV